MTHGVLEFVNPKLEGILALEIAKCKNGKKNVCNIKFDDEPPTLYIISQTSAFIDNDGYMGYM